MLREKINQTLLKNKDKRQEVLAALDFLRVIEPGTKDQLIKGDLQMTALHDRKGQLKHLELVVLLATERFGFSEQELQGSLLLWGSASWSLQSNLQQHPRLVELLKKHYRERPANSQDLIKKWLRIDQPKFVFDKESLQLQGTWQATGWEEDGNNADPKVTAEILKYVRWNFDEDEVSISRAFTVTTDGKTEVKGQGGTSICSFAIDASKKPKVMTLVDNSSGLTFRQIWKLEGNVLTICRNQIADGLPNAFSVPEGSRRILITLKKIP